MAAVEQERVALPPIGRWLRTSIHDARMRGKMLLPADMEQVMEPTDQTLWAQAQAGDAAAFGALYQRHARAVYRFCFWRTADAGLAEELSAAVFLEAWHRRGRTPLTQPSVLPWLLGVAVNLLRNQRRGARRRKAALDRLPPLQQSPTRPTRSPRGWTPNRPCA